MGKKSKIGQEVNCKNDVDKLLNEVHLLIICPEFEHLNKLYRSIKCILYIKGKQITYTACRFLKNNFNKNLLKVQYFALF